MMRRFARKLMPSAAVYAVRRFRHGEQYTNWTDVCRAGWYNSDAGELFPGFDIGPDDVYADVGCGGGGSAHFAAARGAEIIGVDILPECIAKLQRELEGVARKVTAIVSDGNPLPIPSGTATRVVCQEVLEHVPDPAQFLSELVRIGRPGAKYLLTVPDPVSESVQKKFAPPSYWAPPNHVRVFQREQFSRLVVDSGLRIEKRTRYGFYWAMWWTLFWGAGRHVPFGSGRTKPLALWNRLWGTLIADPKYAKVVEAFEDLMPKSQIIIAVKD